MFLKTEWKNKHRAWKIIVADNGSTDGTRKLVEQVKSEHNDHVEYFFIKEPGRGNALKEVVRCFESLIYLYLDADIPIPPNELPLLLKPLETNNADLAIGKRIGNRPFKRRVLTKGLKLINYILFGLDIFDSQCGIKGFNRAAKKIFLYTCEESGYFLDTEFLVQATRNNIRLTEIPIHWIEQRYLHRTSKVRLLHDSLKAFRALKGLTYRLYPNIIKSLVLFLVTGLTMVTLFYIHAKNVALPIGYPVSEQVPYFTEKVIIFAVLFSLSFILVALSSRFIKKMPKNLVISIVLFIFIIISTIAITTPPTRSQDIYWNLLLAKGFSEYGLNPYQTTPAALEHHPWAIPVQAWKDFSMTHGPLWTILLSMVAITNSLPLAITILKLTYFVMIVMSGIILWHLTYFHKFSDEKRGQLLILLAWNPFIIQNVLIDLHSDIFILVSIIISYWFFIKEKYVSSVIPIIIGGFIKYVSWLLIPLIIFRYFKKHGLKKTVYFTIALVGLGAILGIILYSPFGLSFKTLSGISRHSEYVNLFFSFPTILLFKPFGWHNIYFFGLILGLLILSLCAKKREWLFAYTFPYIGIFLFTTPWFQPWYALWILPLISLYVSPLTLTVISVSLILIHHVMPVFILAPLVGTLAVSLYLGKKSLNPWLLHNKKEVK
ncbi:glycosyltransferase [Candidatus Jorgensenbacteria bacterium]|nr:glycosyltransferase [Candidatus Jorgensenbacteria bacterium]